MVGVCVCIEAAFYCDQQLLWRPLNQSMTSCVCILMTGNQAREDRQVPEWRHDGLVMSLACRRRRCLLKCVLHVALCGCAVLGQWAQTGTDVDNIFSFLYFFVFYPRRYASVVTSYGPVYACLSQIDLLLKGTDGFYHGDFFRPILQCIVRKFS